MNDFRRSIRWRMQVWHGFLLFVILVIFGGTIFWFVHRDKMREVDDALYQQLRALIPAIASLDMPRDFPGPPRSRGFRHPWQDDDTSERFSELRQTLLKNAEDAGYYCAIWYSNGNLGYHSSNAPPDIPFPKSLKTSTTNSSPDTFSPGPFRDFRRDMGQFPPMGGRSFQEYSRDRDDVRERVFISPSGVRMVVGQSLKPLRAELLRLGSLFITVGSVVLVASFLVGWWLATRALQPIKDISTTSERIASGNLSERINVADAGSELDQLGHVLNDAFARLQAALARQVQFTADASHELRTPVFIILSQAQSALRRERSVAEYQEGFGVCQRAAQHMRQIIESLLLLAQQDAGENHGHETCAFDQITTEAINLLQPLATERLITIHSHLEKVVVLGNPTRLRQLVVNLVSNAIQYNHPRGTINVSTSVNNHQATLTVADNGQGISNKDLPHIFDRFYRADKARSEEGHVGIGLTICKAIIEAHGGSITVSSQLNVKTTFVVRLPAVQLSGYSRKSVSDHTLQN